MLLYHPPPLTDIDTGRLEKLPVFLPKITLTLDLLLSPPLPSGRGSRTIETKTNRFRNSFCPRAVTAITPAVALYHLLELHFESFTVLIFLLDNDNDHEDVCCCNTGVDKLFFIGVFFGAMTINFYSISFQKWWQILLE